MTGPRETAVESGQEDRKPLLGDGLTDAQKKIGLGVALACCGCCCVVYLALVAFFAYAGNRFLATLQHKENYQVYSSDGTKVVPTDVAEYEWWLSCKGGENVSNCGAECCNCVERDHFRRYTSSADYKEVFFPSREGDADQQVVNLTGWWLPADPAQEGGAAIVLQHGLTGSINDFRPALAAYLVRAAGFSVLLPNIRGHGSSEMPSHGKMSWGYDYPYDTLGAWDYVVKDPDGKLGGPRDASKVGLMGFSMGGFVAATAFGLEHEAPALWLDGPVFTPADTLKAAVTAPYLGPFAGLVDALVLPLAWGITELTAGVSLTHHTPEKTLPSGPKAQRPVMLAQSKDDADVPGFMADKYVDLFKALGDRYVLSSLFTLGGQCVSGDRVETHNMLQWLHPQEYRQALCDFWSKALLGNDCDESILVPSYVEPS